MATGKTVHVDVHIWLWKMEQERENKIKKEQQSDRQRAEKQEDREGDRTVKGWDHNHLIVLEDGQACCKLKRKSESHLLSTERRACELLQSLLDRGMYCSINCFDENWPTEPRYLSMGHLKIVLCNIIKVHHHPSHCKWQLRCSHRVWIMASVSYAIKTNYPASVTCGH